MREWIKRASFLAREYGKKLEMSDAMIEWAIKTIEKIPMKKESFKQRETIPDEVETRKIVDAILYEAGYNRARISPIFKSTKQRFAEILGIKRKEIDLYRAWCFS